MGGSTDPQASWSQLTFANQASFGNFTTQPSNLGSIPNVRGAVRTARDNGAAINTDVTGNFTTSSIPNLNDFTDSRSITATSTRTRGVVEGTFDTHYRQHDEWVNSILYSLIERLLYYHGCKTV
jgi:hypothetical protein